MTPVCRRGIVFSAVLSKMHDYHFKYTGGLHCIATGMHWFPTDFPTIQAFNDL